MNEVVIIGGGPAGVSAALYTTRAGISTKIIYKDNGALETAEKIDNFYGSPGVSGRGLVISGLAHAKEMGADIINSEVVKIEHQFDGDGNFVIETTDSRHTPQALLLATGASRAMPKIPGLLEYESKGVSQCAICDAFFYKGKDVAVLGHGEYALSEVKVLLPLVKSVTVLTNGKEPEASFPADVIVCKEIVKEILGETRLSGVALEPAEEIVQISGLFIAIGTAGATALARKIGALTEDNAVIVDNNMQTNIPGLWAAGDCTAGMKQIAKAVYDGAKAGTDIVKYMRENS